MTDNVTVNGTVYRTKDVGGVQHPGNVLTDFAGADVLGLVDATPAPLTFLGRLKAIVDRLPTLGPKASSGSMSFTPATDAGMATSLKQDEAKGLLAAIVASAPPFPIAKHATNPLEREIKALGIKEGGTIVFRHPDESSDRTIDLIAGLWPMRATHIRATSTATGLTGF